MKRFAVVFLSGLAFPALALANAHVSGIVPASTTPKAGASVQLTVTAYTSAGTAWAGQPVSISGPVGSTDVITPISTKTSSAGVFTATLVATTAGAQQITALIGTGSSQQTVNTTVTVAPAAASTANQTTPSSLVAGASSFAADTSDTFTVTLADAYGNLISGVTPTFSVSGVSGTFSYPSGHTTVSGVLTVEFTSTHAGNAVISATSGIKLTQSVTVDPAAPSTTNSTVAVPKGTVVANGDTSTITVTAKDAFKNLIPQMPVSIVSSDPNDQITLAGTGNTSSTGVETATIATTDVGSAGPHVITVTLGSGSNQVVLPTVSIDFVPGAPSTANQTTPSSLVAGASSFAAGASDTVTVTLADAYGNLISGAKPTFSVSGISGTFTYPNGHATVSGVLTVDFTSTHAGNAVISATSGIKLTQSVTVDPAAPSTTNSTVAVPKGTVVANGDASTITVTAKDAFKNLISQMPVSIVSSDPNDQITLAGTGNTSSTGVETATIATTDVGSAGPHVITVTLGSGSNQVVLPTVSIDFVAGAAVSAHSSLTATPTTQTADGSSTISLSMSFADANGNPVVNQPVSLSGSGAANTFSHPANTSSSGTTTATLASTKAQTETIKAIVGTGASKLTVEGPQITFTPGAPVSGKLTVSPSTAIVADGSSQATLTVALLDDHGNAVTDTTVSWTTNSTEAVVSPGASTLTATVTSTAAGTVQVTATDGTASVSANVVFVPRPPSAGNSTVWADHDGEPIGGSVLVGVYVLVHDTSNTAMVNEPVSLKVTPSATLASASLTTGATGLCNTTLRASAAGTYTITATAGTGKSAVVVGSTSVTFVKAVPAQAKSLITGPSTGTPADGIAGATVTVTVKDAKGDLLDHQWVSFTTPSGVVATPSWTYTQDGVATTSVSSTQTGLQTVTATVGEGLLGSPSNESPADVTNPLTSEPWGTPPVLFSLETSVSFASGPQATLTAQACSPYIYVVDGAETHCNSDPTVPADGSGYYTLTITTPEPWTNFTLTGFSATDDALLGYDINDNPCFIPTDYLNYCSVESGQTLSFYTVSNGTFSARVSSSVVETETITANVGSLQIPLSISFVPPAPTTGGGGSSLQISPVYGDGNAYACADGQAQINVDVGVSDFNGLLFSGWNVVLTPSGTDNTWSGAGAQTGNAFQGTTNSGGSLETTLVSQTVQNEVITAQISPPGGGPAVLTLTGTAHFVACNPTVASAALVASPSVLNADGSASTSVTLTLLDANSNPVPNVQVSLDAPGQEGVTGAFGSYSFATPPQGSISSNTASPSNCDNNECVVGTTLGNGQASWVLTSAQPMTEILSVTVGITPDNTLTATAPATFTPCGSAGSGLLAYYSFDSLSSSDDSFSDLSGNNLVAIATPDITTAPGILGNAASFMTATSAITVSDPGNAFPLNGARSFCAWVMPSSSAALGMPVFSGGSPGAGDIFGLAGSSAPAQVAPGDLYFEDNGTVLNDSTEAVASGAWSHVCWTFDGSSTFQFYLNGQTVAAASDPLSSLVTYDAGSIVIGGSAIDASTTQAAFSGLIDEAGIWSRQLSAVEVAALYNGIGPSLATPTTGNGCQPVAGVPYAPTSSITASMLPPGSAGPGPSSVPEDGQTPWYISVLVNDENGEPVVGAPVTVTAVAGNGSGNGVSFGTGTIGPSSSGPLPAITGPSGLLVFVTAGTQQRDWPTVVTATVGSGPQAFTLTTSITFEFQEQ